jgi:hypothetical protein
MKGNLVLKQRFLFLCLLLSAFFSGCASVPMAKPEADIAAKSFSVSPGKANLYIYRDETFGAAIKMPVLLNGQAIGDTAAQTYILRTVDPGSYTITSKSEVDSILKVDAVAGRNYFVWQEVKLGAFAARSLLQLVDETKGRAAVQTCTLIQ